MQRIRMVLGLAWAGALGLWAAPAPDPAPQRFQQEVPRGYGPSEGLPAGAIQLVDLDLEGRPRVFVGGGWYGLRGAAWERVGALDGSGPARFVFGGPDGRAASAELAGEKVIQVVRNRERVWVVTAEDPFVWTGTELRSMGWPSRNRVHQVAAGGGGELWVASSAGLFRQAPEGWVAVGILDAGGRAWGVRDVLGVAWDGMGRLYAATRAGVARRDGAGWTFFEGKDGLPWNDFTGVAAGGGEEVWFGTRLGLVRFDGKEWAYRQGRLWLPNDEVRQVVVDGSGTVWAGTAGGVGSIGKRWMTLAEKAAHYEGEIERYIKRTPFGYVAEAGLGRPGDRSSAKPGDSDNDGLWTAMYGAGEAFGYAATKDAEARARAKAAFEALRFLQKVTQGGSHAPPKGYVARTIRPMDWPDPNVGRLDRDRAEQKEDALWKVYEPRWPKSADGKWYWKSDTSSDELDGHYFFYGLYHEFCAETEEEKARVAEVVGDLTDHLVAQGFNLVDFDGKPTRWGIYGPESVNNDPNWWAERGLKSLSMLSYLAVAERVTGRERYGAAARQLIDRHGYAHNAMFPKVQHGIGSGNQSDDEMAFMCFYTLLRYSKDEALKGLIRYSFFRAWANEAPEMNPFFHFAYAGLNSGREASNPWGSYSVSPWPGWHEDSVATLRGFPLDRVQWGHRNGHRLDIVPLPPQAARDLYDQRGGRGLRVNGKVLPVENRHFNHWNTDPWALDYGGDGGELAAGTVFLLPYYMGLYHGFIEKP